MKMLFALGVILTLTGCAEWTPYMNPNWQTTGNQWEAPPKIDVPPSNIVVPEPFDPNVKIDIPKYQIPPMDNTRPRIDFPKYQPPPITR